jgi:2-oxoglutarate dehydrogenase E1 component
MTPKSLLRHPFARRPRRRELAEGRFQLVIDDETVKQPAKVRRLVLCSGKIHVDLATSEARKDKIHRGARPRRTALSVPGGQIRAVLDRYPKLRDVCWVQEEPENMGAWEFARPLLEQLIDGRWPLRYIGRVRNSSPSEGLVHVARRQPARDRRAGLRAEGRREGAGPGALQAGLTRVQVQGAGAGAECEC